MPTRAGSRPVDAGVLPGLLRRSERQQDVAVHPPRLLRRGDRGRVEALHLARDPDRELARVEGLDEVDRRSRRPRAARHVDGASSPIGVIAPSPVTATLLIGQS